MIMPQEKEGTIKFNLWVRNGVFLDTMTFMKTKYGERHIVEFYAASKFALNQMMHSKTSETNLKQENISDKCKLCSDHDELEKQTVLTQITLIILIT